MKPLSYLFLLPLLVQIIGGLISPSQLSHVPNLRVNQVLSLNWAGYVVASSFSSPSHTVTAAYGSWVVQTVSPTFRPEYSSQWVGIGGYFAGDSSLIQTGTESDSALGTTSYYAWYELLPAPETVIHGFTVGPGDKIFAEVFVVKVINSTTQEWNITIDDVTRGEHFSILVDYSSSMLSAEWIEERPSIAHSLTTLADFSVSYFGFDYTGIQMTEEATVNGITGTIGQLNHVSITMVSRNFQVLATPSTLSYDGTSFSVTYGGP
jgi:hypothetical protein